MIICVRLWLQQETGERTPLTPSHHIRGRLDGHGRDSPLPFPSDINDHSTQRYPD